MVYCAALARYAMPANVGTRREPFNFTPTGVNPISSGPLGDSIGALHGDECEPVGEDTGSALLVEQLVGAADLTVRRAEHGVLEVRAQDGAGDGDGFLPGKHPSVELDGTLEIVDRQLGPAERTSQSFMHLCLGS